MSPTITLVSDKLNPSQLCRSDFGLPVIVTGTHWLVLSPTSLWQHLNMSSCNICLDYVKNGDYSKPHTRDYCNWYLSREYFVDRSYVYGSLLFHSLNIIDTRSLHENTCKDHAKERVRLLNHFSFLADYNNSSGTTYFSDASAQKNTEYIVRRNSKSQELTLYHLSDIEERVAEIHCEVILPVGEGMDYNYQDVFWAQIPDMKEGVVYAKLQISINVDFVLPILVLSQPYSFSPRIGVAYSKIWTSCLQDQPVYVGFMKLVSNCFGTLNMAYEFSDQFDETKKYDCHAFFQFLLHHTASNVLDSLQQQLDFILPRTEDFISYDSILDISQPAAQLKSPILSLPSVHFLLKVLYFRRNMLALRSGSAHGSLFAAVSQKSSNYFTNNVNDNCPNYAMSDFDIVCQSQ